MSQSNTLIGISTYLKNDACSQLLETLIKNGYHEGNRILIADDADGHARPVFEEYRKQCKLVYATGPNLGISRCKNRQLKYFYSKPHFEDILMLDDDLLFHRPGLIEHIRMACADAKHKFMTGYWTDFHMEKEENIKGVSGKGWYEDFPVKAATEYVSWHNGSQGAVMYVQRSAAEKVGYFDLLPAKYGYEHSLYFSRLLKAHALCPSVFPVLKYCEVWYKGNNIPNNYEVDREELFGIQAQRHDYLLTQIAQGYNIYSKDHGLNKKKEVLIDG